MMPSNFKEAVATVGQAQRLPVRGRQAERLPCNQKNEALGIGWWSVQQSFVERKSAARDNASLARTGSYNKRKDQ